MSITALSDPDHKFYKKSFHRRNDSGELDVFEAARYFSGYNELPQKIVRDERQGCRVGRMSLDVPMRNSFPQQSHGVVEKQITKEKKYKQPSSPGGKLASFLNSLFSQSASKKKKSKSTTQSMKDEEESPGGRRKRRISISHFRSSSTTADSKSIYSSSSSGFRTPPPYNNAQTPTKSYKDLRSYSDHKQVVGNLSNQNIGKVSDDRKNRDLNWLDEKFEFSKGFSEKCKNSSSNVFLEKDRIWVDRYHPSEEMKFNEVDDGAESDSSSDLFELQNYDLGYCSSGLPVYETTDMDSIKRGAPISNAAL